MPTDARVNEIAAAANANAYARADASHIDGSPHLKHAALRERYAKLIGGAFERSRHLDAPPRVLDLGAGEGSVTLPFVELGASIVAVDISAAQLEALRGKLGARAASVETRCADVMSALESLSREGRRFDIAVCNSFLHHIPDYLALIRKTCDLLDARGQFLSFQDPLLYASLDRFTRTFSTCAYFSWRVLKGDVLGGLARRIRRSRGKFNDSPEDNAEYHATRGGVDQRAIQSALREVGFDCEVVRYFSTQSSLFQPLGTALGLTNTFAIVAQRHD